jgi:predicted CopG family antitoxin
MPKCTILIDSITRERLKEFGREGQTYDELINELIKRKKIFQDSLNPTVKSVQSRELRNT